MQVTITAVLAWHLLPQDFGLISMAAVALAFVAPLNEMGLGAALVQRKEIEPGHAVAVFWCQVAVASAFAGVIALAAPLIAAFFGRDDLVVLLRVMSIGLPLGAAAAVPRALLTRSMRFGGLAGVELAAMAGSGSVAIGLAVTGAGVWSLVAQSLLGTTITTVLLLGITRFNPVSISARPGLGHLRDLFGFGAPLTAYQFLNYISRNIDDILIGRVLGAEALGYYSMAYRVMMYPLQNVSGVVGRVSFPTFSSMQDDLERIRRAYLKVVQYIALITFPMMATMLVVAPAVTRVLFGPKWDPVAPLIMVFSIAGMAMSVGTTTGNIFLARGRTGLMLKWELFSAACLVTAIVIGLSWGLMGVAVSYTIMSLILWPLSHFLANRLIGLSLTGFFRSLLPPAALAAVIAAGVAGLRMVWFPVATSDRALFLVACALIGAVVFAAAAALGRPAAIGEVMVLARETLWSGKRTAQG